MIPPQIRLVAATEPLLTALTDSPAQFAALIGSPAPAGWPQFDEAIGFAKDYLRTACPADAEWLMYFFIDRDTDVLVGSGGFAGPPANRTVEIGYEIAPAFRRRGLGSAAARALVAQASLSGAVDRVVAHTLPGPNPSTGVLTSLWFDRAGEQHDPEAGPVWRWQFDIASSDSDAVTDWVRATVEALTPLADPERAPAMAAYMKGVAPFLGIPAAPRRAAQRVAWTPLPLLDIPGLAAVVRGLWTLPEREFQYAACDLLARHAKRLPKNFLHAPIRDLITTRPWWDTVDALESAAVVPLVGDDPAQVALMWDWLTTDDRWLVRTAIQHQRGRGPATDLPRLFAMCDVVADEREYFVAKAVGWALRDAAAIDPARVEQFLLTHPNLPAVSRREAERGLARASGTTCAGSP